MKPFLITPLLLLIACSDPIEPSPPFIHVNIIAPAGFTPPTANRFEVSVAAVLNGNPIS